MPNIKSFPQHFRFSTNYNLIPFLVPFEKCLLADFNVPVNIECPHSPSCSQMSGAYPLVAVKKSPRVSWMVEAISKPLFTKNLLNFWDVTLTYFGGLCTSIFREKSASYLAAERVVIIPLPLVRTDMASGAYFEGGHEGPPFVYQGICFQGEGKDGNRSRLWFHYSVGGSVTNKAVPPMELDTGMVMMERFTGVQPLKWFEYEIGN